MNVTSPETFSEERSGPSPCSISRILVVDDDPGSAAAIASLLRNRGFEVVVAPDYRLALEEVESTRPIDLLITDIVMPERVNGLALSRMARMRRPALKVIYITAYDIPGVDAEALGAILLKPVDDENLITEVKHAIAPPDGTSHAV
jgi:CheY-like chemotaxis protein